MNDGEPASTIASIIFFREHTAIARPARRRRVSAETMNPTPTKPSGLERNLGWKLFPYAGDMWGEKYFAFLDENPAATFHHATTNDGIQIIYCAAKDKGIWFKPGVGSGPMQPKGLAILKQIVEGR